MTFDSLDSDAALTAHLTGLLEAAIRRQCWLLPLDDEQRTGDAVVILEDVPVDPGPEEVEHFVSILHRLLEEASASSVVIVWERPGGPDLRMLEADWAVAVAAADVPVRAQLLLHDDGLRIIDPAFDALVA